MANETKKKVAPGVYRLKGGRYRIRATVTDRRTGKRLDKMMTCPAGTTKGDAIRAQAGLVEDLQAQVDAVAPVVALPSTLSDYAERWIELKAKRSRASRMQNLVDALAKWILPKLGHLPVEDITRRDVEQWVVWSERVTKPNGTGYSQATALTWWRILCAILRDATAEYRLTHDPTHRVRPPRRRGGVRRERRTLGSKQLEGMLDTVKRFFPHRYPEVLCLALTGIRAGELYALRWSDIEFAERRILVRRSVWRGNVGPTKTVDPRVVPLHRRLAAVLHGHRAWMEMNEHRGLKRDLVFPSNTGGHRVSASLHKPLAYAAEHLGIDVRVTPQVLRRTFNTLLVMAGVDRIVQRSMMGHSSEQMTERYAGISIEAKHAALDQLLLENEE